MLEVAMRQLALLVVTKYFECHYILGITWLILVRRPCIAWTVFVVKVMPCHQRFECHYILGITWLILVRRPCIAWTVFVVRVMPCHQALWMPLYTRQHLIDINKHVPCVCVVWWLGEDRSLKQKHSPLLRSLHYHWIRSWRHNCEVAMACEKLGLCLFHVRLP